MKIKKSIKDKLNKKKNDDKIIVDESPDVWFGKSMKAMRDLYLKESTWKK